MQPPGSFKITRSGRRLGGRLAGRLPSRNQAYDDYVDALAYGDLRVQRIVDSLRREIVDGGPGQDLRIRRVFETPREIFRVELDVPGMSYQRTTLLDREALEELLEAEEVRDALCAPLDEIGEDFAEGALVAVEERPR
ncbi:MAG: hypothetical protein ACQGVK_09075 [Myxococcota bacterium]